MYVCVDVNNSKKMEGVKRVIAGYTGGLEPFPNYRNIQDHALALFVEFNPNKVSLHSILQMWNDNDDPWTSATEGEDYDVILQNEIMRQLRRGGETTMSSSMLDTGGGCTDVILNNGGECFNNERSAIYTTSPEQHSICLEFVAQLARSRPNDILHVDVDRATSFYQAEEYHQDYIMKQIKAAKEHVEAYRNGQIKSGLFTIFE